jgi:tetratricopeptide (TPR) repeat protein
MDGSVIQEAVEGNDPKLAAEALREIAVRLGTVTDHEEKMLLLFSRAHCYGILENFNEARRHLELALEEGIGDPDTKMVFEFGSGLLAQREGKYAEALDIFSAMLATYSERLVHSDVRFMYEDVQQRRAFLSVTLSKFEDAIPLLKEGLAFRPDKELQTELLARLGLCYLELKDYELARDYILQAVALGLTKEWTGKAHFYLGIAYFHTDMAQEAEREFQLCEQLATDYALPIMDIYGWLSVTYKRLGEIPRAEFYARMKTRN